MSTIAADIHQVRDTLESKIILMLNHVERQMAADPDIEPTEDTMVLFLMSLNFAMLGGLVGQITDHAIRERLRLWPHQYGLPIFSRSFDEARQETVK